MIEQELNNGFNQGQLKKIRTSLPTMLRYPIWKVRKLLRQFNSSDGHHLILVVANHFEPAWKKNGGSWDLVTQERRVKEWRRKSISIGQAIQDSDGTPFRHTNFYPAEQYHKSLLEQLAELQAEGIGEIEIHLHHGVEQPDTADNLRRTLVEFRDVLAERHNLLSRMLGKDTPVYAFTHGNFALGNMDGGQCCGVDEEMQILADTGCYLDLTLPTIPYVSQVPRINAIYQCGRPLHERLPHRSGADLSVGNLLKLPVLMTGPLVLDWRYRQRGIPFPRIDNGVLAGNYPLDLDRIRNWRRAGISIRGRAEWVFIKLFCHGFFEQDQDAVIGETIRRSLGEVMEHSVRTGEFKIHFASAREAFNIALAAVDGHSGDPHQYRNYKLHTIMQSKVASTPETERPIKAAA
ncbi:MAG: hypothetical protein HYZ51_00060 [Candidatus Doudnabacteria bacterium]|nr:hypothetical protein [Candidatus Doudnabacteria bacterium]